MKKALYLLSFLLCSSAFSQSLSVFDIDTTAFPTIKAKFFAFDAAGNQITNFSASDFQVTENGQPRAVSIVSCPIQQPAIPISSVLVMDISGSMCGDGLDIADAAANAWIDILPLGKSECAITSFSDENYLNQDFTTNKTKLVSGINQLACLNGTNYDAALLSPAAGGILVAQSGKHKRVIVFLSDGEPNFDPNTAQIISQANANNITIYCITIGIPAPQCMKDFSKQTSGLCFEHIRTKKEAEECYRKILMIEQGGEPCTIEWQSGISCQSGLTNVEINLPSLNLTVNAIYQPPNSSVAKLEFNPASARFVKATKDTCITVTITARNATYNISNITTSNPAYRINPPTSFTLNAGESRDLTVCYNPADSGYTYSKFTFENEICPTKYYASGGFPGKKPTVRTLKLLQPNGAEVFVAGSDTTIIWEGVLPEEKVKIEYSIDSGTTWIPICDTASGLSYSWRVPNTPSNKCLVRVIAKNNSVAYGDNMVLISAGSFDMGNTGAYSGITDDKPVHRVTISRDFLMSKYEITQKQYEEVIGTNPSYFKGENLPVETVSWYDAVEFCNKLSEKEGLEPYYIINGTDVQCNWDAGGYRLPTEAEWEYACKAGTTTDFYSGSLTNPDCSPIDANLDIIGWYCGNFSNSTIHEVGQKEPNAFGLYDMSGNVLEWCWDWYDFYLSTPITDPSGPSNGMYRVMRGGAWTVWALGCRSAIRFPTGPDCFSWSGGFRVVRTY